jgi:hypothetical protein
MHDVLSLGNDVRADALCRLGPKLGGALPDNMGPHVTPMEAISVEENACHIQALR